MGRKRGRPKDEDSKKYRLEIRLSREELGALEFIQRKTGKSKSEILRELAKEKRDSLVRELMNGY